MVHAFECTLSLKCLKKRHRNVISVHLGGHQNEVGWFLLPRCTSSLTVCISAELIVDDWMKWFMNSSAPVFVLERFEETPQGMLFQYTKVRWADFLQPLCTFSLYVSVRTSAVLNCSPLGHAKLISCLMDSLRALAFCFNKFPLSVCAIILESPLPHPSPQKREKKMTRQYGPQTSFFLNFTGHPNTISIDNQEYPLANKVVFVFLFIFFI